jgi:hypothetical protein
VPRLRCRLSKRPKKDSIIKSDSYPYFYDKVTKLSLIGAALLDESTKLLNAVFTIFEQLGDVASLITLE